MRGPAAGVLRRAPLTRGAAAAGPARDACDAYSAARWGSPGRIDHVDAQDHAPEPIGLTRITLRPIASPLPLGLLAVMVAGTLLSLEQLGAFPVREGRTVAALILAFAVPLQLLATIFAFLARDTVAATGLGLFTGGWLGTGVAMLTTQPGASSKALGVFAIGLAVAFVTVIAGATFGKIGPAAVISVGSLRFVLTGISELTGSAGLRHASGLVGCGLVLTALYSAVAVAMEDVSGSRRLPIGRRGRAAAALEGPLPAQVERLEHEAGVRDQL